MPEKQNLEEQLLSQAAEISVTGQLAAIEEIDIYVQTDLLKIVQGQADTVIFAGQGLVTKQNLRVQEIKLKTDDIAINPIKAIFGQIQLDKPVNLMARVILQEEDINYNLSSDFVRLLVQNFELDVDGKIVKFAIEHLQIHLPDNKRIQVQGTIEIQAQNHQNILGFNAVFCPRTDANPIILEQFNCTQGEGVSLELMFSLIQKITKLVNSPYLVWEEMKFQVKNLQVHKGKLVLLVEADVHQVPNAVTELIQS